MQRYESYRDSGIEWLGCVPGHWKYKRLKHLAFVNPVLRLSPSEEKDIACFLPMKNVSNNGAVDYGTKKEIKQLIQGFTSFRKHDVIVAKITPCFENGKGAHLGEMPADLGFGSTEFHVLRCRKRAHPKYIYYLSKSHLFMSLGEQMMTGSAGQKRVPSSFVSNFLLAAPPYKEQTAIATFLDRKTTQIDQAVAIKEQQITLLKERKQILIQNAVTRGLNPDAPMRDSGVEWIGEMPVHWKGERFKYLFTQSRLELRKGDGVVTSYRDGQVTLRSKRRLGGYTEAILEQGYQGIRIGQLVLNSMDAFEGAIGVSDSDGKCTPEYVVCDPVLDKYHPEYFALLLREMALARYIQVICNAVRQRAVRIRYNNLAQRFMVVPPEDEQIAIITHIETESAKINKAIDLQQQQIEHLKEYKATLINSAVTGKIKVPGVEELQEETLAG
ncbi:restriction endonuclease subunit S [Candidatus Vondammii sp. HM_W22]|uniref:restriction endonuclease subunit S n=1 Tax=Candidatus Vondammii sp. HM_W22 TaxID=2687299 RepID=UPI00403D5D87